MMANMKRRPMSLIHDVIRLLARYGTSPAIGALLLLSASLALPESPQADAATAKRYNQNTSGLRNIRLAAQQGTEDLVFRFGLGHGDPVGPDYGGASNDIRVLRAKTCAADLIVTAQLEPGSESAFSENGATIFTVRKLRVTEVLRATTNVRSAHGDISVALFGGTVVVNGHKISVIQPSVSALRDGSSYLLFLKAIPDSGTFESFPQSTFELNDGQVWPIVLGKPPVFGFGEVRREIESVIPACPQDEGAGALAY
jgi:hypothetical protein